MAEEITIEVGALHADLHEQLEGMLEDQYVESMRAETEDIIHEYYKQVERMQEQEEDIEQKEEVLEDA